VVAISFLEAEIEQADGKEIYYLKDLRTGGKASFDKKIIIDRIFQILTVCTLGLLGTTSAVLIYSCLGIGP
tara:strand:- start:34 stop:246 length:213 start_codon:yes stop_codon:yes gene_type:complete